jgi:hypothetical protein
MPEWLRSKLETIPHTYCPWKELYYHPVAATLKGGRVEPCVVIFSEEGYRNTWGEVARDRRYIELFEIEDVSPSPYQMPPHIAFELYQADENRMGGLDFFLIMRDRKRIPFCYGGIKDFVRLPGVYTTADIWGFELGRDSWNRASVSWEWYSGPPYAWCLYSEREDILRKINFRIYPYPRFSGLTDEADKYYPIP